MARTLRREGALKKLEPLHLERSGGPREHRERLAIETKRPPEAGDRDVRPERPPLGSEPGRSRRCFAGFAKTLQFISTHFRKHPAGAAHRRKRRVPPHPQKPGCRRRGKCPLQRIADPFEVRFPEKADGEVQIRFRDRPHPSAPQAGGEFPAGLGELRPEIRGKRNRGKQPDGGLHRSPSVRRSRSSA